MAHDHDDHAAGMSRRGALRGLMWGAGILTVAGGLPAPWRTGGRADAAAAPTPTIEVIVRATAKPDWQSVLAGARKAGADLGAEVLALGAQPETDVDGQIAILRNAVAAKPAALVVAPAQFAA